MKTINIIKGPTQDLNDITLGIIINSLIRLIEGGTDILVLINKNHNKAILG